MKDYAGMAAALYDGGWRSEDLYEIQREYNLDDIDRDEIASWLRQYEHKFELCAAALHGCGWKSSDRARMMNEYNLTEEEADELCLALYEMEQDL